MLLPIVGLLLVTSEWSQRTALTTFTLVPERSRVIVAAKLLAGCALALAAVALCLALAAVGNLIAGGSWDFQFSHLARPRSTSCSACSARWRSAC